MKKFHSFWLLTLISGLLLVGAALVSCAPDDSAPELEAPTAVADAGDQPVADTGAADELVTATFTDQACLDCHTDEARLQELAVDEGPAESLSEGPG
jgi:mono/diheme cytochrome c family protein